MLTGLTLGIPTVIHPLGGFDPGQMLDLLEAEKVTGIFLVPAQWQAVCAAQRHARATCRMRVMLVGRRPRVGHAAAPDGRDVPEHQDPGGVRPDRDVTR